MVFKAAYSVNNLAHVHSLVKADDGNDGRSKDRFGKSADHRIIEVPVGTIVRNINGKIIGDLDREGSMFLAARGGAGMMKNLNLILLHSVQKKTCWFLRIVLF